MSSHKIMSKSCSSKSNLMRYLSSNPIQFYTWKWKFNMLQKFGINSKCNVKFICWTSKFELSHSNSEAGCIIASSCEWFFSLIFLNSGFIYEFCVWRYQSKGIRAKSKKCFIVHWVVSAFNHLDSGSSQITSRMQHIHYPTDWTISLE